MTDHPRVEELRRRVQQDPASIAFAALAEELRKLGRFSEAIDTCRAGLEQHPSYLSARVTLGRSLAETDQPADAAAEFQYVLKAAPDNLLARKGLAEVFRRQGDLPSALEHLRLAAMLAPQDPELAEGIWATEQKLACGGSDLVNTARSETTAGEAATENPGSSVAASLGDSRVESDLAGRRQLQALEALLNAIQRARNALSVVGRR
jgi:tetratricopeptide (TPR) repeat protein